MPKKVAISNLHSGTKEILNVIRSSIGGSYAKYVPEVVDPVRDVIKVGEVLDGYPDLANAFLNELIGRIALVMINSSTFNNTFKRYKRGVLQYGEVIENIFIELTKAFPYAPEKAYAEEFKRNVPKVKTSFHVLNYKVYYKVTIEKETLRGAFDYERGLIDFIMKIVDTLSKSAEYDEYLLFKYLLIKGVNNGSIIKEVIPNNIEDQTVAFRAISNDMTFLRTKYNSKNVLNNVPVERQAILMDSFYAAQYDVKVLSNAFNMSKAEYLAKMTLVDDLTTFDNDRFTEIVEYTDGFEPITQTELDNMKNVKAIELDTEYFMIFDRLSTFAENGSKVGLYWNYIYHVWKYVSYNPFANAVAFVVGEETPTAPDTLTVEVTQKSVSETGTILIVDTPTMSDGGGTPPNYTHLPTENNVKNLISTREYGVYTIPPNVTTIEIDIIHNATGTHYKDSTSLTVDANVGDTIEIVKS